jgi:hypothetical protein
MENLKNYLEIINYNLFCFDYLIKDNRNEKKYLVKVVKDANTITKKSYKHLVIFSKLTNSVPLIIAERYNVKNELKNNVYYFFKNVPMMNEDTFTRLIEKNDLKYIHKHKPKRTNKPFFEEVRERLDKEFENLKKEVLIKIKEVNEELVKIERIVNFHLNYENAFIKTTSRFEKGKEEKIINFSKENEKKVVFLSKQHKKEIFEEDFIVLPYKKLEPKTFIEIKNLLEELY